jgi:hypothetical protein
VISTLLKLDGLFDEGRVANRPLVAGQFTELEPTPGCAEKHATEVRVLC